MNGAIILILSGVYFILAYFIYGRFIAKRFGINPKTPTPAHTLQDGVDYVPSHPAVLFGHHFASIAGAGPIIGPIAAAACGWLPAFLWIVIGCVFIGAMHDFAATFISLRHEGRSIAYAIEEQLGYCGRQLFLLFCLATLLLVVAIFTLNVADGFLASPAVATSSILFIAMAPACGLLTSRKLLPLPDASLVFVPLLFLCVWVGTLLPFDLAALLGDAHRARTVWTVALLYYACVASILPVWILLQPRDYLNSYLLYVMMFLGIAGVLVAQPAINYPATDFTDGIAPKVFPLLFVTIACGACSGFHALVASGTTSKQLDNERHALPVAYGGMLLEGVLAILSVLSFAYLTKDQATALFSGPGKAPAAIIFARGLATFSSKLGLPYDLCYNFMSLSISAFLLTSLDTATRLARFVWQELTLPRASKTCDAKADDGEVTCACQLRQFISSRWAGTILVVILAGGLAISGDGNEIWPVFGASNQLLAALTLLAVTLWLLRRRLPALFALLPMLFMMLISIWALVCLIVQKWGNSWTLVVISVTLIGLAFVLAAMALPAVIHSYKKKA